MAEIKPTTQNATQEGAKEFKPTNAQLALLGTLVMQGIKAPTATAETVKFCLYRENTKDNKNIVVGVNGNGNVSKYGTTTVVLDLKANTYSVAYEYLAKEFEVLPNWLTPLLKDYKKVDAVAKTVSTASQVRAQKATIDKQAEEIAALEKKILELSTKPKGK